MITLLNILISSYVIPESDLVLSHNSSRDVPISFSSVPKIHIVLSHKRCCYHLKILHMITFLKLLKSHFGIPKSDLVLSHNSSHDVPISTPLVLKSHIVMSHNSSRYDPNINFSCPKKHIIMSHNLSWRDLKSTSPVPKNQLVQSQNLPSYDHKSTSPVPKSHLVLSHISSCYDPILTSPVPKVASFSPIICLVMTQYHILLSQNITMFVP
jgi:hypothetical protein